MMILTCPTCATRFFVEATKIGSAGRKVMCDACGAVWTAHAPKDSPAPMTGSEWTAQPPTNEPAVQPAPIPALESAPLFVQRPSERPRPPKAPRRIAGLVLTVIVVAVVGAFVFQHAIVRAWPASARVYDQLGARAPASEPGRPGA